MHSCKVTSKTGGYITNMEYQECIQVLKHSDFHHTLKQLYYNLQRSDLSMLMWQERSCELPMKRNLFRLLEIKGRIQGQEVIFLIDTGAQISAFRRSRFEKLHMEAVQSLEVASFGGGKEQLSVTIAESVEIGCVKVCNLPMIILDETNFSMKIAGFDLMRFDAILGWDVLSRIDFELDDIQHVFRIVENTYRFKYPNAVKGSFPMMLGRRANEVVRLGIDTGSYYSWISKEYMEAHEMESETVETLAYGVHGKEAVVTGQARQFDVLLDRGYIVLKDMIQGPCELFQGFHYDAILGNEIFKGRRIRFLNSASMVLFT